MRIRRLTLEAGDPTRAAARARHGPNIICVGESNLRFADRWRSQQTSLRVGSLSLSCKCAEDQNTSHQGREQIETVMRQAAAWENKGATAGVRRKSSLRHVVIPPDRMAYCAILLARSCVVGQSFPTMRLGS